MAELGKGKYGHLAEHCLLVAQARAVVLIVVGGNQGSGMSMTYELAGEPEPLFDLPRTLRFIADEIDKTKAAIGGN